MLGVGGGKIGFYWPKSRLTARFEAEFVGDIAEKKLNFKSEKSTVKFICYL